MTQNKFEINLVKGKQIEKIVIYEIEAHERKEKKRIGSAYGLDIPHCAYLAAKNEVDFFERVRWYHINKDVDEALGKLRVLQPQSIRVEFYEPANKRAELIRLPRKGLALYPQPARIELLLAA